MDQKTVTLAALFLFFGMICLVAAALVFWATKDRLRGPAGASGPPGPAGPCPSVEAVRAVIQDVIATMPTRIRQKPGSMPLSKEAREGLERAGFVFEEPHFSMPLSEDGRRRLQEERAQLKVETPSCAEILMSRSLMRAIRHRMKGIGENQPGQTYEEVLNELDDMVKDITGFLEGDLRIQLPPLWVAVAYGNSVDVLGIFSDPEKARQHCEPHQRSFYAPLFLDEARETESQWPGRVNVNW